MLDLPALKREYEALKADRAPVEAKWQDIERFCDPWGSGRLASTPDGEGSIDRDRVEIYDFTSIEGLEKLAANFYATVASPAIRWFRLTFGDKMLDEDVEAQTFLEQLGDLVWDTLQESDFNTEAASGIRDLVTYGNIFLVCEELPLQFKDQPWRGLDFTGVAVREGYFVEDSRGGLLRFYRGLRWTAAQCVHRFGDAVPEKISEANKLGRVHERWEVVFCIYERPDKRVRNESDEQLAKVQSIEERSFGWCYFLAESGEQLGEEGGYYEMPAFLARWDKTAGSIWGHGPGQLVLPTQKLLNALWEAFLTAAQKAIDPGWLTTERGLMGDANHEPGGITVAQNLDELKQLVSGANFPLNEKLIERIQAMIRHALHEDELTMKDSPAMTATEAQIRFDLMNRLLASTLTRVETELFSPLILLIVNMLWRAGKFPAVPASVTAMLKKMGGRFQIEYQGPLARAQRTDEVAAIERLAAFVAGLLKIGFPEAQEVFDPAAAVREVSRRLGCPAGVLRPQEDQEKRSKQREDLQNRMANATAAKEEGAAVEQAGVAHEQLSSAAGAAQGLPVPARPTALVSPTFDGGGQ
jgi:hypothetical protein